MRKAKLLAALARSSPLQIFASMGEVSGRDMAQATYTKHKCVSCHTEVAFGSESPIQPFCPACGCETVPGVPVQLPPPVEDVFTSVSCPHCSSQNIVEDRTLAPYEGRMHCVTCSNQITFATANLSTEDLPEDDLDLFGEGEPTLVTSSKGKGKAVANAEDPAAAAANAVAREAEAVAQGAKAASDAANAAGVSTEDVDLSEAVQESDKVSVVPDTSEGEENARLLACVGGVPVMTLAAGDAGDNADILLTAAFAHAVKRHAKTKGIKALSALGFKPIVIKAGVSSHIKAQIASAVSAETARLQKEHEAYRQQFGECFALASACLTKGFYKGKSNPLQDVLVASLNQLGFSQAGRVVRQSMQQAAPEFLQAAMALAEELMGKDSSVRNQITATVLDMDADSVVDPEGEDLLAIGDPANDVGGVDAALKSSPEAILARLTNPVVSRKHVTASVGVKSAFVTPAAQRIAELRRGGH